MNIIKEKRPPMITRAALKRDRGWTDKMLGAFLPAPDLVTKNPNYKSGPPMLLFEVAKIEAIESSDNFKAAMASSAGRKAGAKKAIETKTQKMREWLSSLVITVPVLERGDLINRACQSYNRMQNERAMEGRDYNDPVDEDSDAKFLERITVNYLRHRLTRYERHLDTMSGKVGFDEGYCELRRKIFDAIGESYEWLRAECVRQNSDDWA